LIAGTAALSVHSEEETQMPSGAPVIEAPETRRMPEDFPDEDVVSLEPTVREALTRVGPRPAARWRILAYKWFVLIRRTD
jgi:hypothetical protein